MRECMGRGGSACAIFCAGQWHLHQRTSENVKVCLAERSQVCRSMCMQIKTHTYACNAITEHRNMSRVCSKTNRVSTGRERTVEWTPRWLPQISRAEGTDFSPICDPVIVLLCDHCESCGEMGVDMNSIHFTILMMISSFICLQF